MQQGEGVLDELQRMSRLLALVAVKGVDVAEATVLLHQAGYGQAEIAKLLDRKPSAVGMTLLRHRQGKKLKPTRKAASNGARG